MSEAATIGHNRPPPYDESAVAALEARVRELADAGGAWLDLKVIEDDARAAKLNDFLSQCRASVREIEDARKAAKEPHLEAGRLIDARFRTLTAPVEALGKSLKVMLTAFLAEKQRRTDEERRAREAEARRQAEEAERLRREAEARNDVIAQARAAEAAAEAERAAMEAAREVRAQVTSATGGGKTVSMRVTWRARVTDDSALLRAIGWLRNDLPSRDALIAEVERLCSAARRRKDGPEEIPGVVWDEERTAA